MLHQLTNKLNNRFLLLICYSIQICRNLISRNVASMQTPHHRVFIHVYAYKNRERHVKDRQRQKHRQQGGGMRNGVQFQMNVYGYGHKRALS